MVTIDGFIASKPGCPGLLHRMYKLKQGQYRSFSLASDWLDRGEEELDLN